MIRCSLFIQFQLNAQKIIRSVQPNSEGTIQLVLIEQYAQLTTI